jgi:anti-sigma factor RsiW
MRAQGTSGPRPPELSDRELWRRSQESEAPLDETEWLLDLAAFAEHRLDDDDTARVAALIARDADAAGDVAAARALAGSAMAAADEQTALRAAVLVGEDRPEAQLIAFPMRRPMTRPWYSAATWSSLAAAIALAGWLGFDLGNGLSGTLPTGRSADEMSASELIDPAPLLLRDFTDSSQI